MSNPTPQMIQPPNSLRAKIGGKLPALEASALARAEAALKSLAGEFQGWMEEEVAKIDRAFALCLETDYAPEATDALYAAGHDAKGLGATYEYPIVTRIAASLCRILDKRTDPDCIAGAAPLIAAHVNAIKAAVRNRIKTEDHPTGQALVAELEAHAYAIVNRE